MNSSTVLEKDRKVRAVALHFCCVNEKTDKFRQTCSVHSQDVAWYFWFIIKTNDVSQTLLYRLCSLLTNWETVGFVPPLTRIIFSFFLALHTTRTEKKRLPIFSQSILSYRGNLFSLVGLIIRNFVSLTTPFYNNEYTRY